MTKTKGKKFLESYDAIVIGSGMGGLSAAVHAALFQQKTLLLEQHNSPGGFATSFVRGRYDMEATLHELLDIGEPDAPGPVRQILDEAGVKYDLVRVPEPYAISVPSEDLDEVLPFGIEPYTDYICERVGEGEDEIRRYMKDLSNLYDFTLYLRECSSKGEMPNPTTIIGKYPTCFKYGHTTVDEMKADYDLPEKAWKMINPYWCYQGPPTSVLTSMTWAYMICGYLTTGAYVPRDRSHALSTGFLERFRELGGQAEFNCRVDKILVENKKVKGVRLQDGTEIGAKMVFCNAQPHSTYAHMIEPESEVPIFEKKRMNAMRTTNSAFTVFLGLDGTAEEIGIPLYEYFIGDSSDSEENYSHLFKYGRPHWLSGICLDMAVPGTTGEGICQLSITGLPFGDSWKEITQEEYFDAKDEIAMAIIEMYENALNVNLKDHIEEIDVATPATWSRYTTAWKGMVFGYEQEPWNSVTVRLAAWDKERPHMIEGLDFVGGSSVQGHAYSTSITSGKAVVAHLIHEMQTGQV